MKRLLPLLLLSSISAHAAVTDAATHEKKLFKASGWSDMTAQLKGALPSNVVKEFAKFADDIDFPKTRMIQNRLVLIEDGTKVQILFKKDGAITVNGKDWRFRPLGTVEEEVTRLALFISGEKKAESTLFGLLPAASAAGNVDLGAAAAAYASANKWKAEACGEKSLSSDLKTDCPLMAVKMQPQKPSTRVITDKDLFLPVNLKCPAENNGTLELISKNINGEGERVRVSYEDMKPVGASLATAESKGSFEEFFRVTLATSTDASSIENGKALSKQMEPVLQKVCYGSAKDRQRYLASLDSNRADLRQNSDGIAEPVSGDSADAL